MKDDERPALTRERLLGGAMAIADGEGIAAVTIRSIALYFGVSPMSVYRHVLSKEEILDRLVDRVLDEIEAPSGGGAWRDHLRGRAESTRQALRRHPWALTLLSSGVGAVPAARRRHDAVLGTLRDAGMTSGLAASGVAVIDSFVYGFPIQEAGVPPGGPDAVGDGFAFGLELILDGLERAALRHSGESDRTG